MVITEAAELTGRAPNRGEAEEEQSADDSGESTTEQTMELRQNDMSVRVKPAKLLACVSGMMYHLSRIFSAASPERGCSLSLQTGVKLKREQMDKRLAMGHKEDDHEEVLNNKYFMELR